MTTMVTVMPGIPSTDRDIISDVGEGGNGVVQCTSVQLNP